MNASLRTDDVMRYQDARFQTIAAKLLPTQYLVVDDTTALTTTLGSCVAACLRDPVLDVERYTLTYSEPRKLLEELRGLGATHADAARERHLTGKSHYRAMLAAYEAMRVDGRIPATWEVVTAHAWGPPPGQSRRLPGGGEVASFLLSSLKGSRRR